LGEMTNLAGSGLVEDDFELAAFAFNVSRFIAEIQHAFFFQVFEGEGPFLKVCSESMRTRPF